jgi:predicted transposase YdaD
MALTNAERQARFRQRQKEKGFVYKYIDPQKLEAAAAYQQLAEEEREERMKAARKAGRESERQKHYTRGKTSGIVSCASFLIVQGREDLAALLLAEHKLSRQACLDNGLTDSDIQTLDQAKVWEGKGG